MYKKQMEKQFKYVRNLVRRYNRKHPVDKLILYRMFSSRAVWITNSEASISRILYLDWSKASLKTLFSTI